MDGAYVIWIITLIIEILYFGMLRRRPHSNEDNLYIITIIVVTLVVGVTGLLVFSKGNGI